MTVLSEGRDMSFIRTENVYIWFEQSQCVGMLDGRYGCGTTLGGAGWAYIVLHEALQGRLPADSTE